jgi:hypothetical protein
MHLKMLAKLVQIQIAKHVIPKHKMQHYKEDVRFVNLVIHYKYQVKHVQVQKKSA